MPRLALSLMPTPEWAAATAPLFAEGLIDALEWSFDTGWDQRLPTWAERLLDVYASAGALYGHGVHLSPLSAEWTARQARWLARLTGEPRRYVHVSEHFGWSTAGPFVRGAPMPLPHRADALRVGRDRLARLAGACGRPVGLENLALALRRYDAEALPDFLEELLADVDGFIVLDLHNLYCQAHNFGIDPCSLMGRYSAARVRELHLSGGRFATAAGRSFRRDTHDEAIPEAVLGLLDAALERFDVEVVVVERLGDTLGTRASQAEHAGEIRRVRAKLRPTPLAPREPPPALTVHHPPPDEPALAQAQAAWLRALAGGTPAPGALDAWLAEADPAALETASVLARRWLRRA